MLCYQDKTFCALYTTCQSGKDCDRALTPEVQKKAEKSGLPICQMEKPDCYKCFCCKQKDQHKMSCETRKRVVSCK